MVNKGCAGENKNMDKCPFCGSRFVNTWEDEDRGSGKKFYYVKCWDCTGRGPGRLTKKDAITAWDNRAEKREK